MFSAVFKFFIRIVFFTGITFAIHLSILNYLELDLFAHKIILAYAFNILVAVGVFVLLYAFQKKLKDQLGFLFMLGSLIKFGLFFLLFYNAYKEDGNISRLEFLTFFTPYVITLIIEVYSLGKWLNQKDELVS